MLFSAPFIRRNLYFTNIGMLDVKLDRDDLLILYVCCPSVTRIILCKKLRC